MKCKITLQERLKDLRVAHNLNLEELAKLTGISKSALGNYENDDYKEINHGNLVTLVQFYSVSTDYLLCLTENKGTLNYRVGNFHPHDNLEYPIIYIWLYIVCDNKKLLFLGLLYKIITTG